MGGYSTGAKLNDLKTSTQESNTLNPSGTTTTSLVSGEMQTCVTLAVNAKISS